MASAVMVARAAPAAQSAKDLRSEINRVLFSPDVSGLEKLKRLSEEHPGEPRIHEALFLRHYVRCEWGEAYEEIVRALDLSRGPAGGIFDTPESVPYLYLALMVLDSVPDRGALIDVLEKAAESLPPDFIGAGAQAGGMGSDDIRARFLWCLGLLRKEEGKFDDADKAFQGLSWIRDWYVLGPFDNEGGKSFNEALDAETGGFSPAKVYKSSVGEVSWWKPRIKPRDGYIDLAAQLYSQKEALGYACSFVQSATTQTVALKIGSPGSFRVWLNGEEVLSERVNRGRFFHQNTSEPVLLRQGINTVLLKVCQNPDSLQWGFWVRMSAGSEAAQPAWQVADAQPGAILAYPTLAVAEGNRGTTTSLFLHFASVAQKERDDPLAYFHLGVLVGGEYIFDTKEERAAGFMGEAERVLRERGAAGAPTEAGAPGAGSSLLALFRSQYEQDANRRRLALERAIELDSGNVQARVRLAFHYLGSATPLKALPIIQDILRGNPDSLDGNELLARYYVKRFFYYEAESVLKKLLVAHPYYHSARLFYANALRLILSSQERTEILSDLLAHSPVEKIAIITALAEICRAEGDWERYEDLMLQRLEYQPYDYTAWLEVGRMRLARFLYAKALEACERGLGISPYHPELLRLRGEVLHFLGREEESLVSWRRSLEARENQPDLKEYIRHLEPERKDFYSPYETALEDIRDKALAEEPTLTTDANVYYMLDQTVEEVNEDGTSRSYHHIIAKILTESGIEELRSYVIYFVPEREEIKVLKARVIKPDGTQLDSNRIYDSSFMRLLGASQKLYGDYIIKTIELPGVTPGALVEIEYKSSDREKNLYLDYFGALEFPSYYDPTYFSQYVLIAPAKRSFYSKQVRMDVAPTIEVSESQGRRIYTWTVMKSPNYKPEPGMPPYSEILPYLKVSTFTSWEEVATWFWGIAKDQFHVTDDVRAKVRELTRGAKSDTEKARALYNYVVTDVRYLGLEFGVYGYKPHKAVDVYRAQYGDCKDKATLLVAMLGEVGIKAEIALVRTRGKGKMDVTLPSLGIFDHAIVFVPDLDGKEWWLDATAQYYGFDELPFSDQGTQSFTIADGKGRFREIPIAPAEHNAVDYVTRIALLADGSASGTRTITYRGLEAPLVRLYYRTTEKARDLVERSLNRYYAGSRVTTVSVSDVSNLDASPWITYSFVVPGFAQVQGNRAIFKPCLFPNNLTYANAMLTRREFDLVLSHPYRRTYSYTFTLPSGWRFERVPETETVESRFGSAAFSYDAHNQALVFTQGLKINVERVSKDEYQDFRLFCNTVDKKEDAEAFLEQSP